MVTVSSRCRLDPGGNFFVAGATQKLVSCPTDTVAQASDRRGA